VVRIHCVTTSKTISKERRSQKDRIEIVVRQRGIKREKDSDSITKLFAAYLRRAEEGVLGSVLVELTILLTAARQQTAQMLTDRAILIMGNSDLRRGDPRVLFDSQLILGMPCDPGDQQ
jgi:hypothetical protein